MLSLYLCGFPLGDPVFSYSWKSIALIGDSKLPVGKCEIYKVVKDS